MRTMPRPMLRTLVLVSSLAMAAASTATDEAAGTFDLTTASIADINAAFDAGVLTSERLVRAVPRRASRRTTTPGRRSTRCSR